MNPELGVPATWVVVALVALLMLSPLAVGFANRRFQKRERQPARGLQVGVHPLSAAEVAFLKGLTRDVQTYQDRRKRRIITGYIARLGETAVVARTYRMGRQGAYVGVGNLTAAAPALSLRASPLHLLLRIIVIVIVAALALILNVPWWLALIFVALVAWVFWYDHTNEKADLLLHLRTLVQQAAPGPLERLGARAAPARSAAKRKQR